MEIASSTGYAAAIQQGQVRADVAQTALKDEAAAQNAFANTVAAAAGAGGADSGAAPPTGDPNRGQLINITA